MLCKHKLFHQKYTDFDKKKMAASPTRFHHIGNWNCFLDWAYKNDCILKAEDKGKKEETHLLLNGAIGGRLSVPDDKYEGFLRAMELAAMRDDAWLYVVERQTRPAFKMLVELDIELWDHALSIEEVKETVMPPFIRVMEAAYPGKFPRMIICMADSKEVSRAGDRALIKTGIHIIWPETVVNAAIAWRLRSWFLQEISVSNMPFKPDQGWDAVLDPCVFEKNGLRMVWSRKAGSCPDCKGRSRQILLEERKQRKLKRDGTAMSTTARGGSSGGKGSGGSSGQLIIKRLDIQSCDRCQNEGKVDLGRPYHTVAVLSSRGAEIDDAELVQIKRDYLLELRTTSIKVIPRIAEADIPQPAISHEIEALISMFAHKPSKSTIRACTKGIQDLVEPPAGSRKRAAAGATPPSTALTSVMGNDPAYSVIMAYAEKYLTGGRITSIKTDLDRHMYLLNSTCKMCLNKGSEHNQSTVYYLLYPDGLVQKCRSGRARVVYYKDCKVVTPEDNPEMFRPGYMLPPQTCVEFKSDMMHYPLTEMAAIQKIFPSRYAKKFVSLAPISRAASVDADMSSSQRSFEEDSSLGGLGSGGGETSSSLGCLNLLDYNPAIRDAPSFAEARRRAFVGRAALTGSTVTPIPVVAAVGASTGAFADAPMPASDTDIPASIDATQ